MVDSRYSGQISKSSNCSRSIHACAVICPREGRSIDELSCDLGELSDTVTLIDENRLSSAKLKAPKGAFS